MWLNVKWYDAASSPAARGRQVRTDDRDARRAAARSRRSSNLDDPNTKIYEAHYGMTQEWADQLLALGYSGIAAA